MFKYVLNGYATNSRHRHHIQIDIHVIYKKYMSYGLIHEVNIQESLCGSFTVFELTTVGTFNNLYTPVLLSGLPVYLTPHTW